MLDRILSPAILGLLIPIVAILTGGGIVVSLSWIKHRERMAMISMGMHPDRPEEQEEEPALLSEGLEAEPLQGSLPRDLRRLERR